MDYGRNENDTGTGVIFTSSQTKRSCLATHICFKLNNNEATLCTLYDQHCKVVEVFEKSPLHGGSVAITFCNYIKRLKKKKEKIFSFILIKVSFLVHLYTPIEHCHHELLLKLLGPAASLYHMRS